MGKVRTIRIKSSVDGDGIVNLEGKGSSGYKYRVSNTYGYNLNESKTKDGGQAENISLGKHLFYKNDKANEQEKDSYDGKIMISSNCLRHSIFEESMPFSNRSNLTCDRDIAEEVGHPAYILRGYLFTKEKTSEKEETSPVVDPNVEVDLNGDAVPEEVVKGKKAKTKKETDSSPSKSNATTARGRVLSVTHAVQTNNAVPVVETCSTSGKKDNTSLHSKETIDHTTLDFKQSLNMKELMFIEISDENGRLALHSDHCNTFIESFKKHTGLTIEDSQVGYYYLKGQAGNYTRHGILFNKEQVNYLVKYYLKCVASMEITRNNGMATISSLKYLEITDPCLLGQRWDSDSFISLYTFDDIDALDIDPEVRYIKTEKK